MAKHLAGRRHASCQAVFDEKTARAARSIFVMNFRRGGMQPTDLQATIARVMATGFGCVSLVSLDPNPVRCSYAIVEFAKQEAAEAVLAAPRDALPRVNGKRVKVQPRRGPVLPRQQQRQQKLHSNKRDPACLGAELRRLAAAAVPSAEIVKARTIVLGQVTAALRVYFPKVCATIFGSCANGLGSTPDSDLDLSISGFNSEKKSSTSSSTATAAAIDATADDGEIMDDPHYACSRVASILTACTLFEHALPLPRARTPVVRAVHKATGLRVELSFANALGLRNTALLRAYSCASGGSGGLMAPVTYAVRAWARARSLPLNSYTLNLLVLTYLLQCYCLPGQDCDFGLENLQTRYHMSLALNEGSKDSESGDGRGPYCRSFEPCATCLTATLTPHKPSSAAAADNMTNVTMYSGQPPAAKRARLTPNAKDVTLPVVVAKRHDSSSSSGDGGGRSGNDSSGGVPIYGKESEGDGSVVQSNVVENPKPRCVIGLWDCSFCPHVLPDRQEAPDNHLGRALIGFFDFLSKTRFTTSTVCPRLGKVLENRDSKSLSSCSAPAPAATAAAAAVDAAALFIEDPFESSHNVSRAVTIGQLVRLQTEATTTSAMLRAGHPMHNALVKNASSVLRVRLPRALASVSH
eukprot:UC1_evm4s1708